MKAAECRHVFKRFGKNEVFRDLNLSFEEKRIYALLGPNGAGKTTLLKLLSTQFLPNEGEIFIAGGKAYENEAVLKQMCFMTESLLGFDGYRLDRIFRIARNFYENWDGEYQERLCRMYGLDLTKKLSDLSRGKQTAVNLVIGMASGCPIVMFDEIYAGMDPAARQRFYEVLAEDWEKQPRTFLISTHLIEEMSRMFTDVVILHKGNVLLNEELETVQEKAWRIAGAREKIDALSVEKVLDRKYIGSVGEASVYGELAPEKRAQLQKDGFEISRLTLQELFLAMTA